MAINQERIIVSACLFGIRCRYDGQSKLNEKIIELARQGNVVPICPEQLGGLPTPRVGVERVGDKVLTRDGVDMTKQYYQGAEESLKIAQLVRCTKAILKARSPSCGSGKIYDGSFSGNLTDGDGICSELFKNHGIKVETEENYKP